MWFVVVSSLLLLSSILPYINHSHWFFRVFEYGKIQLLFLQFITLIFSFVSLNEHSVLSKILQILTIIFIFLHLIALYKFTPFYKAIQKKNCDKSSEKITAISANVYQKNNNYDKFNQLIAKYNPDLFLTIESDSKWNEALKHFDNDYKYSIKVPLDNTYGMHLFSKIKILEHKIHYFVADDLPCIEARMLSNDGYEFTFFGVHPPPPSPTEEENSKERDGELLSVAKRIKAIEDTSIIIGDFNNVAWAKSSLLFRKKSETLDGRMGRGFISTFHAKYWFLRFPIDLLFHTTDVFIDELKSLEYFGSDHFPIYTKFFINKSIEIQDQHIETLEKEENKEVEDLIEEGKKEQSNNRGQKVESSNNMEII